MFPIHLENWCSTCSAYSPYIHWFEEPGRPVSEASWPVSCMHPQNWNKSPLQVFYLAGTKLRVKKADGSIGN
jgi:hypothetical protein